MDDPLHRRTQRAHRLRWGAVALATAVLALTWPRWTPEGPTHAAVASSVASMDVRRNPVLPALRVADFGRDTPPLDVRLVADWALSTGDNGPRHLVLVDKRRAHVYLLSPQGRLLADAPALLGAAVGDHTAPGVGDKPLSLVQPDEKTTPAGRFIAELGVNTEGEDIVWVDYDAAVSMHRVRARVKAERRLQRLASPSPEDNRISFGCINLPVAFYEQRLRPAVQREGAVIYVLPEVQSLREALGAYDVHLYAQRAAEGHVRQSPGS